MTRVAAEKSINGVQETKISILSVDKNDKDKNEVDRPGHAEVYISV